MKLIQDPTIVKIRITKKNFCWNIYLLLEHFVFYIFVFVFCPTSRMVSIRESWLFLFFLICLLLVVMSFAALVSRVRKSIDDDVDNIKETTISRCNVFNLFLFCVNRFWINDVHFAWARKWRCPSSGYIVVLSPDIGYNRDKARTEYRLTWPSFAGSIPTPRQSSLSPWARFRERMTLRYLADFGDSAIIFEINIITTEIGVSNVNCATKCMVKRNISNINISVN